MKPGHHSGKKCDPCGGEQQATRYRNNQDQHKVERGEDSHPSAAASSVGNCSGVAPCFSSAVPDIGSAVSGIGIGRFDARVAAAAREIRQQYASAERNAECKAGMQENRKATCRRQETPGGTCYRINKRVSGFGLHQRLRKQHRTAGGNQSTSTTQRQRAGLPSMQQTQPHAQRVQAQGGQHKPGTEQQRAVTGG